MPTVSPETLLNDLKNGPQRIVVYNIGENLGQDLAYFSFYQAIKQYFPQTKILLYRSNVDETNCIGLEDWPAYAKLPVDDLRVAEVKQRYPDGKGGEEDWVARLHKDKPVFPDWFLNPGNADYLWMIGMASSPMWTEGFPGAKIISSSTVAAAIEKYVTEENILPSTPVIDTGVNDKLVPWERMLLEYLVLDNPSYPVRFTPSPEYIWSSQYKDYLRVSLRWPDHVRWYYSIDRQYEMLFEIIDRVRKAGKPVKLVYTLKDGEVGNNFNRGQTHQMLRAVQDACNDVLFVYSWPKAPYRGRPTEQEELDKLKKFGIKNVKKLGIWEDLMLAYHCKTYFSDPGGFAELITTIRKDHQNLFLMPVSYNHGCSYITLNHERKPVNLKINPLCVRQFYSCVPTLNPPEESPRRVTHWTVSYGGKTWKIGDDCHGDDWLAFQNAQEDVFKEMYQATKKDLVAGVVRSYCNS